MPIVVPPAGVVPMGQFDGERLYQLPAAPTIRADRIDPVTQEFESLTADRDAIDAQVVDALWRIRGSGAAVRNTGARFLDVSKLVEQAPTLIETEARFALRRLIQRGDIRVKSVEVVTGTDWAECTVNYINVRAMTRDKRRQAKVRLPEGVSNGQTR